MNAFRVGAGACAIALGMVTPVRAQTTIDVYGGVTGARVPANGTVSLPPAGPAILTSNPTFPSRQTSSWFLGDGAAMLNDAVTDLGILNRVTPLDSASAKLPFERRTGAAFGIRIRRPFRSRFELEASFDVLASRAGPTDQLSAAAEAARASFQDTFTALFASGPFVNTAVDAAATVSDGSSRRIALTGALVMPFGGQHRLSPYFTVGGGVISTIGSAPSVTIRGHYRTTIHAGVPAIDVPIEQVDQITITLHERSTPVGLAGAGVTRSIGGTLSLRIDARVLIGANRTSTVLDASPSNVTGSPAGFIELFTFPSLEFSNNPSTGRQSTLGGSGLHDVTIFKGTGIAAQTIVSVGVVKRF